MLNKIHTENMYSHKKVKHEDIRSKIHISNVPAVQHKACHGGQKGDASGPQEWPTGVKDPDDYW